MTTHYILSDDYDRWSPGEPIEDVASSEDYLHTLYREYAAQASDWDRATFDNWLAMQVEDEEVIKLTTDTEGRILP